MKAIFLNMGRALSVLTMNACDIAKLLIKCVTAIIVSVILLAAVVFSQIAGNIKNFELDKQHAINANAFIREIQRPYVCFMDRNYVAFFQDTAGCAEIREANYKIYLNEEAIREKLQRQEHQPKSTSVNTVIRN